MKLGLAVLVLLLALWQADAASFSATITSGFSSCAGVTSPVYQPTSASTCAYSASAALSSVRWGVAAGAGGRSGLQFEPKSGTFSLTTDTDSYIGKLTHFNFPLSDATYDSNPSFTEIPSVVQLRLGITLTLPTGPTTFQPQFPLQVQETKNDAAPLTGGTCAQATNNPDWNLPNQGISGWNSGLPCCPYGSTIRCSDKITFTNLVDVSAQFDDGTSRYTLQLQGFKDIQSPAGAPVNKFISQEQQNSVAYLYARLTVKCTGDNSCTISQTNQAQQCKVGSCNTASGVCVYNPNTALNGQRCRIPIAVPHPACQQDVCSAGECVLQTKSGSDGTACATTVGTVPSDSCTVQRCSGGICNTVAGPTSPNCTEKASIVSANPCTEQRCVNNKCATRAIENTACTPSGTYDSRCSRGSCKKKIVGPNEVGTCTLKKTNTGGGQNIAACTGLTTGSCKWVQCEGTTNYPKGSCTYSYLSSSTDCGTQPAGDCQRRRCSGSGQCNLINFDSTTSCTSVGGAAVCKSRLCDGSGTCRYVNQANNTACTQTAVDCKISVCDGQGTCQYLPKTTKGSCTGIAVPSSRTCMKRVCIPNRGSCTYSVASPSGTCSSITEQICKNRGCVGTSTSLTTGSFKKCKIVSNEADGGSCKSGYGYHICYRRICRSGKCIKGSNAAYTPSQGTCQSTPTLGTTVTTPTTVSSQECRKRVCDTVTAVCSANTDTSKDNSGCSGAAGGDCTARLCLSGVCGTRNVSTGSCDSSIVVSPDPNECIQRLCGQGGKPAGQCGKVINTGATCDSHWASQYNSGAGLDVDRSCINLKCSDNGTCYIELKGNGVSCGSAACKSSLCQNGKCIITNKPDGTDSSCSGGTSNDCKQPQCVSGSCRTNVIINIGGSCANSGLGVDTCNKRLCNSAGNCNYVYKENPTTACGNDGSNSGCVVKRCANLTAGASAGKGTCADKSDTVIGVACGSPVPGACFVKQCSGTGQCVKRADPTKAAQSCEIAVHCAKRRNVADASEEDEVELHTFDPRATLNPPLSGTSDCGAKPAEDAGCYGYQCSTGGMCNIVAVNSGIGCGPTPPGAIQNGTTFACKQYVCNAGSCNTNAAATVAILEGEFCSGFSPCDPTSDGCNDECQTYVCHSGVCELDLREGETCDYPKRPTYRRGLDKSERDEILVPSECQESRCRGGRCAIWTIDDGTGCGDRQNNSCANDTCINGQCVAAETNCSYLVPPSVCFDVTCDPGTGECAVRLNGKVDCTCIDDCHSCTQVNRLVNETAQITPDLSPLENGACWWCPEAENPGCYNRIDFETGEVIFYEDPVTGERTEKPDPSCFASEDDCSGSSDLTGGEIAGIVVAAVAVAAIAAVALGAAALVARFLQASSTAGEDAILTDVAFESNAADNPFHQSKWTQSDLIGSVAADSVPSAHFVTN